MTAEPVDVARLEGLEAQATSGPWWQEGKEPNIYVYGHVKGGRPNGEGIIQASYYGREHPGACENAEFIAALRNAAPSLLAAYRAVEAVRALHRPGAASAWCDGCEFGWPCQTVRALDGAE